MALIAPKLCTPLSTEELFKVVEGGEYAAEVKLDGVRCLAVVDREAINLLSRTGEDITARYPDVVSDLRSIQNASIYGMFDGEIIVRDLKTGSYSFSNVQKRSGVNDPTKIKILMSAFKAEFYIFDILASAQGTEQPAGVIAKTYDQRKQHLFDLFASKGVYKGMIIRELSPGSLASMLTAIKEGKWTTSEGTRQLEGLVLKRRDSVYNVGSRDKDWYKWKAQRTADCVVIGYDGGEGKREDTIGSLVLMQYKNGSLVYVGKVGTGFSDKMLADLAARMKNQCVLISKKGDGYFDQVGEMFYQCNSPAGWFVVEVKFLERTSDGIMRQPVFVGLREDKKSHECIFDSPLELGDDVPPTGTMGTVTVKVIKPPHRQGVCDKCSFDHDPTAECIAL